MILTAFYCNEHDDGILIHGHLNIPPEWSTYRCYGDRECLLTYHGYISIDVRSNIIESSINKNLYDRDDVWDIKYYINNIYSPDGAEYTNPPSILIDFLNS